MTEEHHDTTQRRWTARSHDVQVIAHVGDTELLILKD